VVLHDQSLQRLWDLDASVGDLDLAEVASIDKVRWDSDPAGGFGIVQLPVMVDFIRGAANRR
jgi:hypothetical protein